MKLRDGQIGAWDARYQKRVTADNEIGRPGEMGFGVGICPRGSVPDGFSGMPGFDILGHENYGNYQFSDGSVMCWIPKFYYRINHPDNPTFAEHTSIKAITGATQANPGVVTIPSHGIPAGTTNAQITISGVVGMTQLNGNTYTCTYVDANSVSIGVDTSGFTAYTSGGWATGPGNSIDVKGVVDFADTAAANAAGYALHRAFIDGGAEQSGFFVDKYMVSKNALGTGYVASSIRFGAPLSTDSAHNQIDDLTACSANNYSETIKAAHARDGVNGAVNASSRFFVTSRFIYGALAMLALAHAQAAKSQAFCGWYLASKMYPKGCNSNALRDTDDTSVYYQSDGYSNCGKTGSGHPFNRTTHNGQDCGVADLNGLMWEVSLGITCVAAEQSITAATQANPCQITIAGHGYSNNDWIMIASVSGMTTLNGKVYKVTVVDPDNFTIGVNSSGYEAYTSGGIATRGTWYAAKQATAMRTFTPSNTGATDHWGATGIAAMMDAFVPPFVPGGASAQLFGNGVNQVLSEATSGDAWLLAGLGFPGVSAGLGSSGQAAFGTDSFYQYVVNELCLISCGGWHHGSDAGVWGANWGNARPGSAGSVGFRAACYLG